jgi:hypothetical protein
MTTLKDTNGEYLLFIRLFSFSFSSKLGRISLVKSETFSSKFNIIICKEGSLGWELYSGDYFITFSSFLSIIFADRSV